MSAARARNGRPIAVTHVVTGLGIGGAELMLLKVLSGVDRERFAPSVISLGDVGVVGARIRALGIPVDGVGLPPGAVTPRGLRRLGRLLRSRRPDIVQTWLYHADFLGGLMARVATDAAVIWGLRGAIDRERSKWHTVAVTDACARLSGRVPDRILSCSNELVRLHVDWGYAPEPMTVIPNGFDVDRLRPDASAAAAVREELRLPADSLLVTLPGRYDPQKDHDTFARAAGRVARARGDVWFALCGNGIDSHNAELWGMLEREGLAERALLLGRRDDMPRLMAASDVVASSSAYGEGFSNVLGEAMACGTPTVSTNVGDAEIVVGDTGLVVPKRDPEALAAAIEDLLGREPASRAELGRAARERIVSHFALPSVVRRYEDLWLETVR